MKKIIEGKMFNTETAKCVGVWGNNLSYRDFNWLEKGLYKTKNGTYFTFCEGGALTEYAKQYGDNQWSGGYQLEPISVDEAKSWAEQYLSADEYIAEFGEPEEA